MQQDIFHHMLKYIDVKTLYQFSLALYHSCDNVIYERYATNNYQILKIKPEKIEITKFIRKEK